MATSRLCELRSRQCRPLAAPHRRDTDYTSREVRGLKRRWNVLNWAGFAIVLIAGVSYVPFFALFPATRDIPWANYLLFLTGGALLAVGVRRAFRDSWHYRGK